MFLAPEIFLGCASPKFWTGIIKQGLLLTIVQNFTPVGPRISEISRVEKKTSGVKHKSAPQAIAFGQTNKLEIWGKAQRESARRPKSDWGNSNALAYAERALST